MTVFATLGPAPAEAASISPLAKGAVTTGQGLAHWARIFDGTSHPHCSTCRVGDDNRPMCSGPSYEKPRPHGMNFDAAECRIGAKCLMCSKYYMSTNGALPHGAPGVELAWQFAPIEAE